MIGWPKFIPIVLVTWPRWPPCPYMVKALKMSSSLEPKGQWPWDLVCSIGDVGPTSFAQMTNLGWPWPTLWQGQIWFLMHLFGKNLVFSTKFQADLWPFIQGHSFGLPHTYLNICFSEITGLFDGLFIRLFKSLDQNVCNIYGKTIFVPLYAVVDLDLF